MRSHGYTYELVPFADLAVGDVFVKLYDWTIYDEHDGEEDVSITSGWQMVNELRDGGIEYGDDSHTAWSNLRHGDEEIAIRRKAV